MKLSVSILEKKKVENNLISRFTNKFGKSTIILTEDFLNSCPTFEFSEYAKYFLDTTSLLQYFAFIAIHKFHYECYKNECMQIYQETKIENDEFVCFKKYLKSINTAWINMNNIFNIVLIELYKVMEYEN